MKKFCFIWIGQFISILGSGLSAFGLSVWIFYETGSATPFALAFLCSILPAIIFAPLAGSFADRKNRKYIIMSTDALDALLKIIMAVLLWLGLMKVWIIYPILFLSSMLSTFQGPAFNASIPMIVPKKNLSRANGMIQFSQASQNMLAPILAGALYPVVGLKGLLIIDFITFFFAITTMSFSKIPQPKINQQNKSIFSNNIEDLKFSWNYLREKNGFISLFMAFAILNFIANIAMILIGPLILSNYSSSIYGITQSIYGLAMVLGGVLSGMLPNTNKKVKTMFMVLMISGIGLVVSGLSSAWYIIATGFFIFFLLVPYANTLLQTLIQTKIEANLLGRISALVNAILKIVMPIACILAGPLSDKVFEPLISTTGKLGLSFIGDLIGTGIGRGIGLLFMLCGVILILVCIIMIFSKNSNTIEQRIPDAKEYL